MVFAEKALFSRRQTPISTVEKVKRFFSPVDRLPSTAENKKVKKYKEKKEQKERFQKSRQGFLRPKMRDTKGKRQPLYRISKKIYR